MVKVIIIYKVYLSIGTHITIFYVSLSLHHVYTASPPFSITLQRYYLFNYRCGFYPLSVAFSPNKVLSVGFRVRSYEIMYTVYQKDFDFSFILCTFAGKTNNHAAHKHTK